jgi:hypothetical protein
LRRKIRYVEDLSARSNKLISRLNNRSVPDPELRDIRQSERKGDRAEPASCSKGHDASHTAADTGQPRLKVALYNQDPPLSSQTGQSHSDSPLNSDYSVIQRPKSPSRFQSVNDRQSQNGLSPLPLRLSCSPLRPSQWATRGGLVSSPPSFGRMRDRFISSRRPPNVHRESFELNEPSKRVKAEERVARGTTPNADPFSRRLQRSGRLDAELRSLRETHSTITGRSNSAQPGSRLSIRRNPNPLESRQVSAGGVWAVGGSSAASDTVVGVADGRGGVLGSGTNAPLYTSMFLNRADPDAELEAYGRRLALAFDIDQADRILTHSSPLSVPSPTKSNNPGVCTGSPSRHVWKDSSWTKDGPATSLPSQLITYRELC